MKILISLLLVVFSIIGMADSSFITYEKFSGVIPECGAGFDCGTVLSSQWSSIGPIPLSLLGFLYYTVIFILAILNFSEFDLTSFIRKQTKNNKLKSSVINFITVQELLLLITLFGLFFSAYLILIMAFVIEAWCKFCLISAFTSTSLFVLVSIYNEKYTKNSPFILKSFSLRTIHFLYAMFVKKICFKLDAESVHSSCTSIGKALGSLKITQIITKVLFSFTNNTTHKTIDKIIFSNPIGLSAGFDYNGDLTDIIPSVGFGFHTIGTVTALPYQGNKKPRLGRYPESKSLLVNKGLKSLGAKAVIKNLEFRKFTIPTGISIASTNKLFNSEKDQILDILKSFKLFENSNVNHSYYELNISCPNTFGGEPFVTSDRLKILLTALEKLRINKPIYIKMPIDQNKKETLKLLKTINPFTISGVIFGNLTKDKTNPDVTMNDKISWKKSKGNLSGKPTWKRSNELIQLTKKHYKDRFTIIGTGGIFTGQDAITKMEYGADLIQIITGMVFQGPQVLGEMNLEISKQTLKK